ncbi:MAG: dephospho-CoA kinase [Muribaculaceae bacterium]|nr:dephospho-CoA kinase [Muribaculaceae bacterium]
MNRVIAITGGIGSGKSVVSRILRVMGYPVYDCDTEARLLMDGDTAISRRIANEISPEAIDDDGKINRPKLAEIVFTDRQALERLNNIVHSAVRDHLRQWIDRHQPTSTCFVETAIPYQSHIDTMVDEIWEVDAPEEIRISRVMARNNLSRREVENRIEAQRYTPDRLHPNTRHIDNSPSSPLLPQLLRLLPS